MNLKFAMVKKYGDVNFVKLSKELGISRQAIYYAINNKSGYDKTRQTLLDWTRD